MTTAPTEPGTRDRIVAAARDLFSRQGYAGTGLKAILTASAAPFGSLYHHFPDGKEELAAEAIRVGGGVYRELVEAIFFEGADVAEATALFFEGAAVVLQASGFEDACPIATIALETASTSEPLRVASAEAFESWLAVLRDRLGAAGIAAERADELAIELFCAVEGAFLLARASHDARPMRVAGQAMARLVAAELRVGAER